MICTTHDLDLGAELRCPKCEAEDKEVRETVLKARSEGKIAMWLLPGQLGITPLEDFLKQPADGILYDLNRLEECALSNAPDIRWVNDFACAMVIRKLVEQRDEALRVAAEQNPSSQEGK